MEIIHGNCYLFCNTYPYSPGHLDICSTMQQLEEVSTFTEIDKQIVFIQFLGYCYKRYQVSMFLYSYKGN